MVSIGFVVEGHSEKMLLSSDIFKEYCRRIGVSIHSPIINAEGGGNLLPNYMENHLRGLTQISPPDKIVVLTDREREPTVEAVRERILVERFRGQIDFVFISVKAIEAWCLADGAAIARWLGISEFSEECPETTPDMPWDRLKAIANDYGKPGPGRNRLFFMRKILKCGFSIERAARHPHCPSAREFHEILVEWGGEVS